MIPNNTHARAPTVKDVYVKDPTGSVINVTDLVKQLPDIYQKEQGAGAEFNKCIDLLNDCIEYSDTIDKQFDKLIDAVSEGLNQDFKRQLELVSLYAKVKFEQYLPIGNKFKELYLNKKKENGISFLCSSLDEKTGGIVPGTVCTIAGGPGSMKTTTAVNICYQAVKQGKNVCYLSLEEAPDKLYAKLLSRVSLDVDVGKDALAVQDITQLNLTDEAKARLFDKVMPYLEGLTGQFHIIGESDLTSYSFNDIESQIKKVDTYTREHSKSNTGIDILVVDHIQLLKYANSEKDEYRLINSYVSFFRRMSLSFLNQQREIIVILLSQVNREGIAYASKHDGTYLMQHVAEASEVERASSYIITVYCDGARQITKQLSMGALKLRDAQIPLEPLRVFADGKFYQVGEAITTQKLANYTYDDVINDVTNCSDKSATELGLSL